MEQEIIKVSICIITYNHEKYIAQCLESILEQRCQFAFEVVIRDDCSRDNTLQIINDYRDKFPGLLRVVTAEENIGANRNLLTVFSHARGKYLAICEGDDYWINDEKLQKQVSFMESHPELTFTSHACRLHDRTGLAEIAYEKAVLPVEISCNDVLAVTGQFAPTASYVFKRDVCKKLPYWFDVAPVGDFFIEMYAIALGKGMHLPEAMSAYRTFSMHSWTTQNNEDQSKNLIKFSEKMKDCLMKMQADPLFKNFDFSRKLAATYFNVATGCLLLRDFQRFNQAISNCYKNFPRLSVTQNIFYFLRKFPLLVFYLYKIKRST